MIALSLKQIAQACNAEVILSKVVSANLAQPITQVVIDSRQATAGSLFIAIAGERVDGHDYLEQAFSNGAVAAIVERKCGDQTAVQLLVNNSVEALGEAAKAYASLLQIPVIAITGSCGKTSTKEMLNGILSVVGNVAATQGNQNNEIGVPLTVFSIESQHDFAVVEMGAAQQGDIDYLMQIVQPSVTAITNIGSAHIERFGSKDLIAEAKSEIYRGLKDSAKAVVNIDEAYSAGWIDMLQGHELIRYSMNNIQADVYASAIVEAAASISFDLHIVNVGVQRITLAVAGMHCVANALCAASLALAVGVDAAAIYKGLQQFSAVAGRMQILSGNWQGILIDDSYNANPASVKAAIDVLVKYPQRKILVLGDMAELGSYSQAAHKEVGAYAKAQGVDHLFAVGVASACACEAFSGAKFFSEQSALAGHLEEFLLEGDVVLFKGSRSSNIDRLVTVFAKKESN